MEVLLTRFRLRGPRVLTTVASCPKIPADLAVLLILPLDHLGLPSLKAAVAVAELHHPRHGPRTLPRQLAKTREGLPSSLLVARHLLRHVRRHSQGPLLLSHHRHGRHNQQQDQALMTQGRLLL